MKTLDLTAALAAMMAKETIRRIDPANPPTEANLPFWIWNNCNVQSRINLSGHWVRWKNSAIYHAFTPFSTAGTHLTHWCPDQPLTPSPPTFL